MNDLEDRLRDAYRAAADTVDPDRIRGLHEHAVRPARRPHRGGAFAPPAAAAAVVAVVVTTSLLAPAAMSRHQSGNPAAAGRRADGPAAHPTPGLPKFVIATTSSEFKVIDTYTWTTVAQVRAPSGRAFAGVAGAADDKTFVLAAMPSQQLSCHAWLYEVRLGSQGQPGSLSLLASDMNWLPTSIAISGDASTVAYSFVHCASGSGTVTQTYSGPIGFITVMKLATGQVRRWSYDLGEDTTGDLSLSADGSLVGFSSYLDAPLGGGTPPSVGRVLSASAQPGTVAQRGRVLFQLTPANATDSGGVTLSADGRTMYAFRAAAHTLAAYDTSSGKRVQVITTSLGLGYSLTAAGHYLLFASGQGGSKFRSVTMSWIDVTSGAITKLPVSLPASKGSDAEPALGL